MTVPNGGDAVAAALLHSGVTTVFGIPASYTVEIYDAIGRQGSIRSIVARNVQAAACMADGYARRSGQPGVVVVTGGPGLGNTVTGLQTAYADSSPLVVIASDHNPSQRSSRLMGLPLSKHRRQVTARIWSRPGPTSRGPSMRNSIRWPRCWPAPPIRSCWPAPA